jgi:two-component system chemotaxis sensor kinase CheA
VPTVLIIDNAATFAKVVATALHRGGYATRLARDGFEAIESLRVGPPDLIVLDMALPAVSGLEVLRAVRTDPVIAATPVIVVSASTDEPTLAEAQALRIQGQFVKSRFALSELLALANELVPVEARAPGAGQKS